MGSHVPQDFELLEVRVAMHQAQAFRLLSHVVVHLLILYYHNRVLINNSRHTQVRYGSRESRQSDSDYRRTSVTRSREARIDHLFDLEFLG